MLNHGDEWLRAFISAPLSLEGERHLGAAIALNYGGNPDQAEEEAGLAKTIFSNINNAAGLLRADLEIVYALRRRSKSLSCQAEIASAQKILKKHRFVWLDLQFGIENSVCAGMHNDFGSASHLAAVLVRRSQNAHYPVLQLRVQALFASWHTLEDRLKQSWLANQEGLKSFWNGVFPAERAFQFYSDLEMAAERSERWRLAALLQREALAMISETRRLDFQALAHFRLATDLMHSHDNAAAQLELSVADELYSKLATKARALFRAYSQLDLAKLEINNGSLQRAANVLNSIGAQYRNTNNFSIEIPLARTLAELAQASGNLKGEREHLQHEIAIANRGLRTLTSPQERWEWRREVESAYRRLLEIDLEQHATAWTTLRHWRAYASLGTEIPGAGGQKVPTTVSSGQNDSATVVIAALSHQTIIWTIKRKKVHMHIIQVDAADLAQLTQQFQSLCSDPSSSMQKVNQVGLRLYQLMIKPSEHDIVGVTHLRIEADDHLGSLPWTALVTEKGLYFSEEHTITLAPSPRVGERRPSASRRTHALLVYPGAAHVGSTLYEALPSAEEEIRYLSALYPGSRILLGPAATRGELLHALPLISLFHFAGHAVTHNGGGELILYGSHSEDSLSASSLSRLSLRKMELVFLAACSSAQVEDSPARNPYGLVWSFLSSGAKNVIASQWAIDSSSTLRFTQAFYRHYRNSRDVGLAANSAAKSVRAEPRTAHPFYWAAFQAFQY